MDTTNEVVEQDGRYGYVCTCGKFVAVEHAWYDDVDGKQKHLGCILKTHGMLEFECPITSCLNNTGENVCTLEFTRQKRPTVECESYEGEMTWTTN